MKLARLQVSWTSSPSTDVVKYKVLVLNETAGTILLDTEVSFAETSVFVEVEENTSLTATVIANDGTYDSEPTSASYTVGDLTAPSPVGSVTFTVVEIIDTDAPVDPSGVDPV